MDKTTEQILRRRMHGLYLSRKCDDIDDLPTLLALNSGGWRWGEQYKA